jgi:hypothetical protein
VRDGILHTCAFLYSRLQGISFIHVLYIHIHITYTYKRTHILHIYYTYITHLLHILHTCASLYSRMQGISVTSTVGENDTERRSRFFALVAKRV